VLMLSHKTTEARRSGVCNSVRSCRSQDDSATARYSASVLERKTVFWHLNNHEMRLCRVP
jgi:hypothetical protein